MKCFFSKTLKVTKARIKVKLQDEEGSISLLIIGLFVVTVATLLVITNIASIAIA